MNEEIFIPISMFAMIFGIVFLYFSTRHKERLALIEKGADSSIFFSGRKGASSPFWKIIVLSFGLLMIGVGTGIFVANFFTTFGMDEDVAYPGTIFLFTGIGLMSAFYMIKRLEKEERDEVTKL